jgi:hypothetical protein
MFLMGWVTSYAIAFTSATKDEAALAQWVVEL